MKVMGSGGVITSTVMMIGREMTAKKIEQLKTTEALDKATTQATKKATKGST